MAKHTEFYKQASSQRLQFLSKPSTQSFPFPVKGEAECLIFFPLMFTHKFIPIWHPQRFSSFLLLSKTILLSCLTISNSKRVVSAQPHHTANNAGLFVTLSPASSWVLYPIDYTSPVLYLRHLSLLVLLYIMTWETRIKRADMVQQARTNISWSSASAMSQCVPNGL